MIFHRFLNNKALLFSVGTILITVVLQLIFIRYASYSIDREDYGNFVLIQTLLSGLTLFFLQMPIQALDRFYNESINKSLIINEFRTLIIVTSSFSFIIVMLYGIVLEKFSIQLLLVVYFLFLLLASYTINQRIFLLNMDRKLYLYLRILEAAAKFLVPIIMYWYYQTLISLFIGMFLGYGISLIVIKMFMRDYPIRFIMIWKNLKKYFDYSYPMIFFSLFTWGISFSDRYFIEYFLETKDVGIYGLLGMVAGVGQILGQIYYIYVEPKILKEHEQNPENAYTQLRKYLNLLVIVFIVLAFIAFFLPKQIYALLLDPELVYNQYYFHTMMILLITVFIGVIHTAHHMYFKLFKKLSLIAYIYFTALVVNLIGNSFIAQYGIIVAAISTLIAYIAILLLQIFYVFRLHKVGATHE